LPDRVKLTIDGKPVEADRGELLIKVAQEHGVYIPRFCWHERMKPVGMCRMCLVEVEGIRGLPPSCTMQVADGMVVHTQNESEAARKAQEGVLEFLLINHPLDCPVCDRGGECPLQDLTMGFGPGDSRFVEEKRHLPKPIPISDLVLLDQERCILCARCTRFADEIAGDPLISFTERGDHTVVLNHPDDPFASYFSGNTVQICPVGALTSKPYRFRARPWDLQTVESTCQTCAVGCRMAVQSSTNRLVRTLGVDLDPVNQGWLCDKGRYGIEWVHAPTRIAAPQIRKDNVFVEVSWPEALDAAAKGLREISSLHGPGAIAVIGGGRGSNEDAYVWARFAKSVLKTANVDCQLGDGLPAACIAGLPRATVPECTEARAVVLLAPDLKEELPVLYLRLRDAALERNLPIIEIGARDSGMSPYAAVRLRHRPGEAGILAERLAAAARGDAPADATVAAAAELMRGGDVVVVLGRPSLAESDDATVRAASALAALPNVRFLSALRRGNVHGAIDMGLAPGLLPGRCDETDGRSWFQQSWGALPKREGLSTTEILRAATEGRIQALVLLGANPIDDFPDRVLARRGLDAIGFVVAVDGFVTEATKQADVLLPAALWGEKSGTTTNLEGRVQRLVRKVTPAGIAMDDWRIAVELAARFDVDFDLETVEEVQDEIARVAPAYRGVDAATLRRAREGVVVPVGEHEEIVIGEASHPVAPVADTDPGAVGGGAEPGRDYYKSDVVAEDAPDAAEPEPAAVVAPTAGAMPAPLVWRAPVFGADVPPPDSYALRLVAGRELYDAGLAVAQSPSLAGLARGATLLISPSDRDRLGLVDGDEVKVTSARGSLVLPARSDPGTPKGVAYLAFNQPGPSAGDLIDATAPVTDVRVETLR
jgi:NADH-quinone oxidoreductase subunit G